MTRLDALIELRDKVKEGEWPGDWREVTRALNLHPDERHILAKRAFDGSLDAAMALHEAVLPGHDWLIRTDEVHGGFANVTTHDFAAHFEISGNSSKSYVDSGASFPAYSVTPARAWLIAILEALMAQEAAV